MELRGKKTLSTQAATSRENSREDSIQIQTDGPQERALLERGKADANINISESAIGGQTIAERRSKPVAPIDTSKLPEVSQSRHYYADVVQVNPGEGAVINEKGAQQRSPRLSYVPEAKFGPMTPKSIHSGHFIASGDGLSRQNTQSRGTGRTKKGP